MIKTPPRFQYFLRTTALCGLAFFCAAPLAAHAFDPNEPAAVAPTKTGSLPSTDALLDPQSKATLPTATRKLANPAAATADFALPANPSIEALAAPLANGASGNPAGVPPLPPAVIAPVAKAPVRIYPPVDATTQAAAARVLQANPTSAGLTPASIPALAPPPPTGFIAPAPLVHTGSTAATAPVVASSVAKPAAIVAAPVLPPAAIPSLQPLPTSAASTVVAAPKTAAPALSDATQRILSHVPSKLDTAEKTKSGKFAVSRMTPEIQPLPKKADVETYDAVGLSIKVQRPGLDTNFELNRAYTALMGGETGQAIEIYKNILSSESANQDALFGLAATYQRIGQRDQARTYYGKLLAANPNHRAGLNNFLALVSEESPESALAELERLEQRNPDFGPIPAQEALVLRKLGYLDRARDKMLRAIELSPTNLAYKYNLAVLLDMSGDYANAATLYRQLIDALLKGEKLPATLETLQKRLNFLVTNATSGAAVN